jgi:hypothetical protein
MKMSERLSDKRLDNVISAFRQAEKQWLKVSSGEMRDALLALEELREWRQEAAQADLVERITPTVTLKGKRHE